jgi:hypothetical protein
MLPGSNLACLGAYSALRLLMVIGDLVLYSNLLVTLGWMATIGIEEGFRRSACLLVEVFGPRASWRCVL